MLGIFGCFFFLTIETLFFLFVVFTREKKKKNKEHKTFSGVGANDKRELPRLAPSQTVGSSSFGLGEVIHTYTHTRRERERERIPVKRLCSANGRGGEGGGELCRVGTTLGFGLAMLHLCGFPAFSVHQELKSGRNWMSIDSHRRHTSSRPIKNPLMSI